MVEQTVDVITYTTDTTNRKQKSGYLNKMPLLFLHCSLKTRNNLYSIGIKCIKTLLLPTSYVFKLQDEHNASSQYVWNERTLSECKNN